MKQQPFDPMACQPGMEAVESDIMERTLDRLREFSTEKYTREDARRAVYAQSRSAEDFAALLSPAAEPLLEELAQAAKRETRRWFGNGVGLFTPLYIANYCENHCTYCGFGSRQKIKRARLTMDELRREAGAIAATGLRELLVLTGECRGACGVAYIGEALRLLKGYFGVLGLEIYPLNVSEYHYLRGCGADYVSVYQETYDPVLYEKAHPLGPKRCYPYRFYAQERALLGGMRGVAFGSLLGLGDFRRDAFAAAFHAYCTQKKYPQAEISFSFPRLRPAGDITNVPNAVTERQLLQIMLAYRLFLPFAGITISTRERPGFRDAAAGLAATKMSAGVSVGVGGHGAAAKGDEQFRIADGRGVAEVREMLARQGLQAIMIDYVRV
jgi:2-iminoacetate synthase